MSIIELFLGVLYLIATSYWLFTCYNKELLLTCRNNLSSDWVNSYHQKSPFWRFESGMRWWIKSNTWFGDNQLSCLIDINAKGPDDTFSFRIKIAYKHAYYYTLLTVDQQRKLKAELENKSGDKYVDLNRIILMHSIDVILGFGRIYW